MSSTFDTVIAQIRTEMQLAVSKEVHTTVNSTISGKPVDHNVVSAVTNTVVNRAMGGIVNNATFSVNSLISKALGSKLKNSALNMIAGNLAVSVLTSVITGRQTPQLTTHMTTTISGQISRELFSKLPSSLTKNVSVDLLGTKFTTGLSSIIAKSINDTVGAVVGSVISNAPPSQATNVRVRGMGTVNSQVSSLTSTIAGTTPSFDVGSIATSLTSLPNMSSGLVEGVMSMASSLGSNVSTLLSSISSFSSPLSSLTIPSGFDLSRFTSGGSGIGKTLELASTPIGSASGMSGMSRSDFGEMQTQLSNNNINNPLLSLGGKFDGISSIISGPTTGSGQRSITKDLTTKFDDINSEFGVISPAEKNTIDTAKSATVEFSKIAATDAAKGAQEFNAVSPDQIEKLVNVKQGFADPNAKYPLPEYSGRSETNKLATGDVKGTIVETKNASRMQGAPLPNGDSWSQPVSPYNGQYPYNHVTESESGHVIEIDDTPGNERIHVYHKTGTFVEVDSVGNMVRTIKGSDYTIVDANGYISIHGKANVSVGGSCNVFVGANANIEVGGNAIVNSKNNIELNAAGRLKLTAGEAIDIKSPEVFIDADNQLQINADVNMKIHTKELNMVVDTDMKVDVYNDVKLTALGNADINVTKKTKIYSKDEMHVKTDAAMYNTAKTDYHIDVGGKAYHTSVGDYNFKSGASIISKATTTYDIIAGAEYNTVASGWFISTPGSTFSSSGGDYSINASGSFAIDASAIWMNSGKSSIVDDKTKVAAAATKATAATVANALETEYSDSHYFSGRTRTIETEIPDKIAKTQTAAKISDMLHDAVTGNTTTTSASTDELKAVLIEDHNISPSAIDQTPIIIEESTTETTPEITTNAIIVPQEYQLGDVAPPSNLKLSPYFTLADLTTNTSHPSKLAPVGELMVLSKVVANLQYIALNVLEPIYAARPDMIIDTGFKQFDENAETLNRSNYGLSVTLDFSDAVTFDDYFEIANIIQRIVPFDEMTLWYMSADFIGNQSETALIVINVPGVYYPTINKNKDADALKQWVDANSKKNTKTWYNMSPVGTGFKRIA